MSAKDHYDDRFGRKDDDINSAVMEINMAHENAMELLSAIVDNCVENRGTIELNYALARSAMAYIAEVSEEMELVSSYVAKAHFAQRSEACAAKQAEDEMTHGFVRERRLASQDAANARRGVPMAASA